MSTFVLIIVLNGTGKAALEVPFVTEERCQKAAEAINHKAGIATLAWCFKR